MGIKFNPFTGTFDFTGASTAASDSFTTIQTDTGTSPVADSPTDTLTITGGSGITVSGNAGTDTVTISFSGSGPFVLKAGDTMTGPLNINGSTNAIQESIKSVSGQTANIFEINNFNSTIPYIAVTKDGRLGIGTQSPLGRLDVQNNNGDNPGIMIYIGNDAPRFIDFDGLGNIGRTDNGTSVALRDATDNMSLDFSGRLLYNSSETLIINYSDINLLVSANNTIFGDSNVIASGVFDSLISGNTNTIDEDSINCVVVGGHDSIIHGGVINSAIYNSVSSNISGGAQAGTILGSSFAEIQGDTVGCLILGGLGQGIAGGATLSLVLGGEGCYVNADADHSILLGGGSNTIGPDISYAMILGGSNNTATASYSLITGGKGSTTFNKFERAFSNSTTESQEGIYLFGHGGPTMGPATIELFTDCISETLILETSTIYCGTLEISAKSELDFAHWVRRVIIHHTVEGPTILECLQIIGSDMGSNSGFPPSDWSIVIDDNSAANFRIQGVDAGTSNIKWGARMTGMKIFRQEPEE